MTRERRNPHTKPFIARPFSCILIFMMCLIKLRLISSSKMTISRSSTSTSTSTSTTRTPALFASRSYSKRTHSNPFQSIISVTHAFIRKPSLFPSLNALHDRQSYTSTALFAAQSSPSSSELHQQQKLLANESDGNIIDDNDDEITLLIRHAYEENETDGIIDMAHQIKTWNAAQNNDCTGHDVIMKALDAVHYNKGQAAGVLNALIASCHRGGRGEQPDHSNNRNNDADFAWELYTTWQDQATDIGLYPDIVTFSCAFAVMHGWSVSHNNGNNDNGNNDNDDYYRDCAEQILDTAQRYSKKLAGSKRRKLLASLSRRKQKDKNTKASDHIDTLQELYGMDFHILFEDDHVIVVSKPSGMVCYHSHKTTSGKIRKKKAGKKKKKNKNQQETDGNNNDNDNDNDNDNNNFHADISLEDALLDIGVQLSTLNADAMGIVHRIDRGTSGTIVLAKNNEAHAKLVTTFFTRNADKSYLALIPFHSTTGTDISGCYDDTDDADDNGVRLQQMNKSGTISHEIGGRPALSKYEIVELFENKNAILLKVQTKTGRKHQVRIHCAKALGRPIFLDPRYSYPNNESDDIIQSEVIKMISLLPECNNSNNGNRFFLHASNLSIEEFGIDVSSEIPTWWNSILSELKK